MSDSKNGAIKKAGRKPRDRNEAFARISPFLQLGYSLQMACLLADEAYSTMAMWAQHDEEFQNRIMREQKKIDAVARLVWFKKIASGNYQAAKDWLEKREKAEMGQSIDITTNGESINTGDKMAGIAEQLNKVLEGAVE